MQDEFTVWKNKKKGIRHVFLFEHLLVLAKTKRVGAGRDQYVYKKSLKVSDKSAAELMIGGQSAVTFMIRGQSLVKLMALITASTCLTCVRTPNCR